MRNIREQFLKVKNTLKGHWEEISGTKELSADKKTKLLLRRAYAAYNEKMESQVSSIIELPEDDRICGQIANESYNKEGFRKATIEDFTLDTKLSTKDAAVYIDKTRQICVIGYRGTVMNSSKDLMSDIQIVLDIQGIDPRVKASLNRYDICKKNYEGFKFRVCGHSLGGTLSYIVAKHREPGKCVVFNPGVSLNTFFLQILEDTIKKVSWTQNTTTYKILGDMVSMVAFVGKTHVFRVKSGDPVKMHTIENFVINKIQEKIEEINKTQ